MIQCTVCKTWTCLPDAKGPCPYHAKIALRMLSHGAKHAPSTDYYSRSTG